MGEVLEQDVVRLVAATLQLLADKGRPMGSGELVNRDFSHPAMTTDPGPVKPRPGLPVAGRDSCVRRTGSALRWTRQCRGGMITRP